LAYPAVDLDRAGPHPEFDQTARLPDRPARARAHRPLEHPVVVARALVVEGQLHRHPRHRAGQRRHAVDVNVLAGVMADRVAPERLRGRPGMQVVQRPGLGGYTSLRRATSSVVWWRWHRGSTVAVDAHLIHSGGPLSQDRQRKAVAAAVLVQPQRTRAQAIRPR
jgi:hypothetical protein